MTAAPDAPRVALGIGGIVADALGFFFRRLHLVLLFSVPAFLIAGGLAYLLFAPDMLNLFDVFDTGGFGTFVSVMTLAAFASAPAGIAGGLLAGALASAHADAASGRRIGVVRAFGTLLVRTPQLAILGGLAAALFGVVWVMAVYVAGVPGILLALPVSAYLMANVALVLPVAALDGGLIRAVRRTAGLVRGRRWAVTLAFTILLFAAVIFSSVISAILGVTGAFNLADDVFGTGGTSSVGIFLSLLVPYVALIGLIALPAIAVAVARRRLVEIAEGMHIEDAVKVFE